MEHGNMTDIDWKAIRISNLEDNVKELEAEKAELIDVIKEIFELANNEEQDVVKGEIYSKAFNLVNKAKGDE